MENVDIFYDQLEYLTAIWYNLRQFGIVCGYLIYFFLFWNVVTKRNLATLCGSVHIWPFFTVSLQIF
jgi:hypothetical protein